LEPLVVWAKAAGFLLPIGGHPYHLLGLRPPPSCNMNADEMNQVCRDMFICDQILIVVRCGSFRISPYLDSTSQDIDRLIGALNKRVLPLLNRK
jgi:hypothetical protein